MSSLYFDSTKYEIKTCEIAGRTITYRAFEGLEYCECPVADIQKLNLFVPECYYQGRELNGYTLKTAPIFAPNTVGGYREGPAEVPGVNRMNGQPNSVFLALEHGYVVASAGIRGNNTGMVGRAPALIVDMKAVVRYLRFNKENIPGDVERIITSGTSAGGALSAMAGATGNHEDYVPYLEAIGAAKESDDIFAANCYCPIHNLENADIAYEWLFCGENEYHRMNFEMTPQGPKVTPVDAEMSEKQIALSADLKKQFPAYLNKLGLRDKEGNALTLDEEGNGSFRDYVKNWILASAQKELDTHWSAGKGGLAVKGSEVEKQSCLSINNGKVMDLDWAGFVQTITRMKATPAFDELTLHSPENELFGNEQIPARHFTTMGLAHSEAGGQLAEDALIKTVNPIRYLGEADVAKHWRIRHGAFDRDTSLAIPVILATLLENAGYDVDFWLPWGLPHSGDYDLDEVFDWIDGLCKE